MALSRFLYVPNIIDYMRVFLAFLAYAVWADHCWVFVACYVGSQLLDMVDGWVARKLNQCTRFGAMMDMVTDRCSGIGLLMTLAWRYPQWQLVCHGLIWLDICSHWAHMLYQYTSGLESHKTVKAGPRLLQVYYKTQWFMVTLIVGAEGLPLCLYVLSFAIDFRPFVIFAGIACFPLFALKHIINVVQFWYAAVMLDRKDE
jgi:CDP-diacylglycerol--inositol 3-phosphatidyltransferase